MISTIVIIEDDPASLALMTYLLSAHGYAALGASSGNEGLDLIRQQRPDLAVCDVQLPGIDGYSIARILKSDTSLRTIPIIAVTALAMVGDRDKALAAGFDAYLSKPIDPQVFVSQLEPLLGKQAANLHVPPALPVAPRTPLQQRGVILVVDDSAVNLELKRSIFEPVGYRVLTAPTCSKGLQLARDERPNVIITDVGLPDGSGLDFLLELKADPHLGDTPVVVITSTHAEAAIRNEALRRGAARFLIRPLDAPRVLSEIELVLEPSYGDHHGSDPGR